MSAELYRHHEVVSLLEAKRDGYRKMADAIDLALDALRGKPGAAR